MSLLKTDGTFTTASAVGKPRISFPIPGDITAYTVDQDFMIFADNFAASALDAAHSTFTTAYLVGESPTQDLGGGVVRWTKTWATKPATRSEYESFAYNFIGFWYWTGGSASIGRPRRTATVLSRTEYKYFRVFSSGGDYTTVAAMHAANAVDAYRYTFATDTDADIDYLVDSTAYPAQRATTPSQSAYETLISGGTEIAAEDSTVRRYMGNIYEIATRYVVAQ